MNKLEVDNRKNEIRFQDQNRKLIYLVRFIFSLNILNSAVFFLIFNNQDDLIKWIWLAFAVINVILLLFCFVKLSLQTNIKFSEIDYAEVKPLFGLYLKLKNGKYRKVYIPRNAPEIEKLTKSFGKKV